MSHRETARLENAEIIKIAGQYRALFEQYANRYQNKMEEAFNQSKETVVREELSSGSDMELGYYCPSQVEDLLVGNVHRGKILKRVTKRSKPDTQYGFSEDGKMVVFVDLPPEGYTDYDVRGFVLYDKCTVTYLCFRKSEGETKTEWISQAGYDAQGRIVRYTSGLFIGNVCDVISQEIYTYSDEGMKKVIMWNYLSENCISQEIYRLHHDSDGFMVGYEVTDSDFWKGHIFEIAPGRRKI